jgi:hypothetical protein
MNFRSDYWQIPWPKVAKTAWRPPPKHRKNGRNFGNWKEDITPTEQRSHMQRTLTGLKIGQP